MFGSLIKNIGNWLRGRRGGDEERAEADAQTSSLLNASMSATETSVPASSSGESSAEAPVRPERRRRRRSRGKRSSEGTAASEGTGAPQIPDERLREKEESPIEAWAISQFDVPPVEGKMRFHDLDLPDGIMHAISDMGYQYCTPIQAALLPGVLTGGDAAGRAQTGTGKTAVFLIKILTHFVNHPLSEKRRKGTPRALVLAPTRELALQIEKDARALSRYTRCKLVCLVGGMDYEKQRRFLTESLVDLVVATPGRLLDFQRQGDVQLGKVEILIIDEADRMLDMGFIPDVQRIVRATPPTEQRETLLFSATLTPEITRLASQWMHNPQTVEIQPEHVAAETVNQMVYTTTIDEKFALLYNVITKQNLERVIVFTNRRDETRRLSNRLERYGISCAALSGDVDQKKRIRTLESFRAGKIRVLVATDVAARGIHIEGVSHVVNFNLPMDPEDYVHRIGRTGRAGAEGTSISFATEDDGFQIPAIEVFIGHPLPCEQPDDAWLELPPPPPALPEEKESVRKRGPAIRERSGRRGPPRRKKEDRESARKAYRTPPP